ncbi:MAG: hypothetical protein ISR83_06655 [Candidatus Marinimicrobia bacterium]|nr:hypothetical protein [Candidatus Neomarinimicrobiota bacterium]
MKKYQIYILAILIAFAVSCSNSTEPKYTEAFTDTWGEITSDNPKTFAASDVSQATIDLTLKWLKTASDAWGNYGPLEIWFVGDSHDATIELDNLWCNTRQQIDPKWNTEWDCANGDPYGSGSGWSPFYRYVDDGGAAVATYRRDYFDYYFLTITMSAKYPSPSETDYIPVTMHEYFHVYQHSHIMDIEQNGDKTPREMKNGGSQKPWFSEGGAEYMAQLLYSKQDGVESGYLKERMTRKFDSVSDYKSHGVRLDALTYDSPVSTYDVGAWFIAYLIHNEGEETFRVDFYKDLNDLGFEGSFLKHFGKSTNEYVDAFDLFLDTGLEEALIIIP